MDPTRREDAGRAEWRPALAGMTQSASRNGQLTTSALARAAGVETSTIRFYERRRLLVADSRRASGYRLYGVDAIRRVRFIRLAQRLGLNLGEIAELLELELPGDALGPDSRKRIERKLASIGERIKRLTTIQVALEALLCLPREQGAAAVSMIDALDALEAGPERR